MSFRQTETPAVAAAWAGFATSSGYRFEQDRAAHPRNDHFATTLWRDGV